MANTFLTAQQIAQQALANLYETTVMASLVHRDFENEFARKQGDAITIRKPAVFTANEYNRASGITVQDATEGSVNMTLNHFADVSFAVTSEDMTLKIQDFDQQLLTPAMEAIAQKIDRDLLLLRSDIVQEVGNTAPNAAGEDYNGYNGSYPYSDSRVLIQAAPSSTGRRFRWPTALSLSAPPPRRSGWRRRPGGRQTGAVPPRACWRRPSATGSAASTRT
ncbi:P22 phage major capsid protein family protein [Kitasatospora fiedleri]|uniref:P22 phage major capsid protein family protein n=1 Tax=Kitasatospora fiedleri TaxID=2991545 RepID=UPI00249A9E7C|nr:P22 phage major capsid protein family protein [Kitasatospora fiedleri]